MDSWEKISKEKRDKVISILGTSQPYIRDLVEAATAEVTTSNKISYFKDNCFDGMRFIKDQNKSGLLGIGLYEGQREIARLTLSTIGSTLYNEHVKDKPTEDYDKSYNNLPLQLRTDYFRFGDLQLLSAKIENGVHSNFGPYVLYLNHDGTFKFMRFNMKVGEYEGGDVSKGYLLESISTNEWKCTSDKRYIFNHDYAPNLRWNTKLGVWGVMVGNKCLNKLRKTKQLTDALIDK